MTREQHVHHGQQSRRIKLAGFGLARIDVAVLPKRSGTEFGRSFKREDVQRKNGGKENQILHARYLDAIT